MKKKALTPMMKQFYDLKEKHPDAIMLFRCGDFYETYCDDAVLAAKVLGITLTKRNNKNANAIEMAGFPHHALDNYLPKLIRAGYRVAICDQLEDPKTTNKLVKRGITELVTPGVVLGDNVLNSKENNFVAALHFAKGINGLALLDISTGEFFIAEGSLKYLDKLLENFAPKEVLVENSKQETFKVTFGNSYYLYHLEDWIFSEETARDKLYKHFNVKSLKGFGIEELHYGIVAAGAILQYLDMTQHTQTSHITSIKRIEQDKFVRLDKFTIRNLELLNAMNSEGKCLRDVLDRTLTPMGARLLSRRLVFPLRNVDSINRRLNAVEYFFKEPEFKELTDDLLQSIGDIERIVSKVSVNRVTPRELIQLRTALDAIAPLKTACEHAIIDEIKAFGAQLNTCEALKKRIAHDLNPNPPALINKGNVIAKGVDEELDELRMISHSGKDFLLKIQQRESQATGIPSLKIGFNNVFGYFIEVRNTYKDKVPNDWIRKQTLVSAERYVTQELKEYEDKILGAEEKISILETKLYNSLVAETAKYIAELQKDATIIAEIDCLLSYALVSQEYHYIRPIVDNSLTLDIHQGRHPVIETMMPIGEKYIANDVFLDSKKQQIIIITGPNMAGKSALLRQTALITLMAQIGCFVPAESARIGVVDKIFTRVGASDNISMGESTFMVEMNEAANIMNNLTERSLILFDELGRGTSTYDGISIAWAIVERIHEFEKGHARTLFATHYHELNEMESIYKRIRNYNVSVKEIDGQIVFLRKLVRGGSEHSFGIHVAKLAGMPPSIVKRAEVILKQLESNNSSEKTQKEALGSQREGMQLNLFQLDDPVLGQIRDTILKTDIDNLTPINALNKLNEIKKILTGKS